MTMTPEQSKELLAVTQEDKDCLQAIEEHAYAANDGGAFISDDALEILARHRQSSEGELVRVLREALMQIELQSTNIAGDFDNDPWAFAQALGTIASTALSRLTTDDLKGRG